MKKVLIVDDAAFIRLSLKKFLINNGFDEDGIYEAENGAKAVQKYIEIKPDVVTMDITMPEMNGVDALKEIIKIDPRAKVIMVSALGQENVVREAVMHGAKGFIIKPYQEEQVIRTIKSMLNML